MPKQVTREQKVRQFTDLQEEVSQFSKMVLQLRLMKEEMDEVEEAMKSWTYIRWKDADFSIGEKAALLKELCDLQYVLSGTVVALGWDKIFDPAFNRVHENNMSKFNGGKEVRKDGKTLKPEGYEKVNLQDLVT